MAHKKGVGSSRNGRDSAGQRRGVKRFGGENVTAGNIILKVWKPTAAADCTPIAAVLAKSVRWIAIGT